MWTGTGIFNRIHEWVAESKTGGKLTAEKLDEEFINLKKGLETCLTRNSETAPTQDLNMANLKHVNVGKAGARNHYATAGEVQDQSYCYANTSSGEANRYKLSLSFSENIVREGQLIHFIAHQNNTGPVRIKINGVRYKTVMKRGDQPLVAGDILEEAMISVIYDGEQFQLLSLASDPKVTIPDQIEPVRSQLVPTGTVISFAGNVIPEGWLICDGKLFNAIEAPIYQALHGVIANIYGGNDATNFRVPDLRGRTIYGQDNMGGIAANRVTHAACGINANEMGATGGAERHTLTVAEIPAHTHGFGSRESQTAVGGADMDRCKMTGQSGPTGGGQAHNNMPPILIMKMLIKI